MTKHYDLDEGETADTGDREREGDPKPGERRKLRVRDFAKRWLIDWSALVATLVGVISVVQAADLPSPFVWVSDFKNFQQEQSIKLDGMNKNFEEVKLAIARQTLSQTQRDLRARIADREAMALERKPIPEYLSSLIEDLQEQVNIIGTEVRRLSGR